MSRRGKKVPSYGLHKPSGQARIIVRGTSIYLGKHGSPESHEAYARWVTKLSAETPPEPVRLTQPDRLHELTVNELLVRYRRAVEYGISHAREQGSEIKDFVPHRSVLMCRGNCFRNQHIWARVEATLGRADWQRYSSGMKSQRHKVCESA